MFTSVYYSVIDKESDWKSRFEQAITEDVWTIHSGHPREQAPCLQGYRICVQEFGQNEMA